MIPNFDPIVKVSYDIPLTEPLLDAIFSALNLIPFYHI